MFEGIFTFFSFPHPENANLPIEVTVSGISNNVNELQFVNAYSSIEVTVVGKSIVVNELHPQNI